MKMNTLSILNNFYHIFQMRRQLNLEWDFVEQSDIVVPSQMLSGRYCTISLDDIDGEGTIKNPSIWVFIRLRRKSRKNTSYWHSSLKIELRRKLLVNYWRFCLYVSGEAFPFFHLYRWNQIKFNNSFLNFSECLSVDELNRILIYGMYCTLCNNIRERARWIMRDKLW